MRTITWRECWDNAIYVSFLFLCFFIVNPGVSCATPVDFPKKEITITVNFGPGGQRDIAARGVGKVMSKYLGVPVIIMNQPGAGGPGGLLAFLTLPLMAILSEWGQDRTLPTKSSRSNRSMTTENLLT